MDIGIQEHYFSCLQCQFKTISQNEMIQHLLNHFSNLKVGFKETLKTSKRKRRMDDGIKEHYFSCLQCEFKTISQNIIIQHLLDHCSNLKLGFKSSKPENLESAQKKRRLIGEKVGDDERYSCLNCKFKTISQPDMIKHLLDSFANLEARASSSTPRNDEYNCCHCEYHTTVKSEIEDHLLIEANNKSHM